MADEEYKMFCCKEAPTCGFQVQAKTKEEVMEHAKAHAESAHDIEVTPEMEKKMEKSITPVTVKQ